MRERVPVIDKLKIEELVGENSHGFLEVRKNENSASSVVSAENADRQIVFAATAKTANSTPEVVGLAFARQIAAASASGVWLQREDGSWYKK